MPVSLTEYHKFNFCPELVFIQHRHMVCGALPICHDLVLVQRVNNNYYSTPFLCEVLDVDHKMVMMGISLYHNTFSHICVKYQYYPDHDTLCMSIFF